MREGLIRLSAWRKNPFDFIVADLVKVPIELSYGKEILRSFQTDDLVGVVAQRLESFRGRDRNRQYDLLWFRPAHSAKRRPHRCSGGDPVVDDDHGLACQWHRGFRAAVFEFAPLCLLELPLDFAVDVAVLDAERFDHFLVEDRVRMIAIDHRADS